LGDEVSVRVAIDFNINETAKSIYMLGRRIQPLLVIRDSPRSALRRIELDLSTCDYFGPVGIAILSLLIKDLRAAGHTVGVIPPLRPQLKAYAEYSGFAELCWEGPPPSLDHPMNETTPIVFATQRRDSEIRRVVQLVQRHSAMNDDMVRSLQTLLGELLMNIQDHAGAEGVMTARWFSVDQTVRVVIADLGMGLRRTLAGSYDVRSDRHAIKLALSDRTSSRPQSRNLGEGLPLVRTLMTRNKGDLILASGDAIFSLIGQDRGPKTKLGALGPNTTLPGTLCALKFRIDHDLYEYDDDDTSALEW
jgi:anti-sigma regulatory factor (Ser/Thr protein kinase)